MNLAIEYMLRSGTALDCLQVPCAIYLNRLDRPKQKLAITIHWHPQKERYMVRHWQMDLAKADKMLPPYEDHFIENKQELFDNSCVVIPMFSLLRFQEEPYPTGTTQQSRGRKAKSQQEEYYQVMDSFFNTHSNRRMRKCWLWSAFLQAHEVETTDAVIQEKVDDQMLIVHNHYKQSWAKWETWRHHLDFPTHVAVELVFHMSYRKKVLVETQEIQERNGYWIAPNPWNSYKGPSVLKWDSGKPTSLANYASTTQDNGEFWYGGHL